MKRTQEQLLAEIRAILARAKPKARSLKHYGHLRLVVDNDKARK